MLVHFKSLTLSSLRRPVLVRRKSFPSEHSYRAGETLRPAVKATENAINQAQDYPGVVQHLHNARDFGFQAQMASDAAQEARTPQEAIKHHERAARQADKASHSHAQAGFAFFECQGTACPNHHPNRSGCSQCIANRVFESHEHHQDVINNPIYQHNVMGENYSAWSAVASAHRSAARNLRKGKSFTNYKTKSLRDESVGAHGASVEAHNATQEGINLYNFPYYEHDQESPWAAEHSLIALEHAANGRHYEAHMAHDDAALASMTRARHIQERANRTEPITLHATYRMSSDLRARALESAQRLREAAKLHKVASALHHDRALDEPEGKSLIYYKKSIVNPKSEQAHNASKSAYRATQALGEDSATGQALHTLQHSETTDEDINNLEELKKHHSDISDSHFYLYLHHQRKAQDATYEKEHELARRHREAMNRHMFAMNRHREAADYNPTKDFHNYHRKDLPQDDFNQQSLRKADFITLPQNVSGTNCSNCKYESRGACHNPNLEGLKVTKRDCCAYWDAEGVIRRWKGNKSLEPEEPDQSEPTPPSAPRSPPNVPTEPPRALQNPSVPASQAPTISESQEDPDHIEGFQVGHTVTDRRTPGRTGKVVALHRSRYSRRPVDRPVEVKWDNDEGEDGEDHSYHLPGELKRQGIEEPKEEAGEPPEDVHPEAHKLAHEIFGKDYRSTIAKILGAEHPDHVLIDYDDAEHGVKATYIGEKYTADRTYYVDEEGNKVCYRDWTQTNKNYKGQYISVRLFFDEVRQLAKLGFNRYENLSVMSPGDMNGAATWAFCGMDASLREIGKRMSILKNREMHRFFPRASRLSHIMLDPDGREWWKNNAVTFEGAFDLDPDSDSMMVMQIYEEMVKKKLEEK